MNSENSTASHPSTLIVNLVDNLGLLTSFRNQAKKAIFFLQKCAFTTILYTTDNLSSPFCSNTFTYFNIFQFFAVIVGPS